MSQPGETPDNGAPITALNQPDDAPQDNQGQANGNPQGQPNGGSQGNSPAIAQPPAAAQGGNPAEPKTVWAENWRQEYAGNDEAMAKRLARFASPKAAIDALIAAQNKISAGIGKSARPKEGAPPEEIAAWRQGAGIPESPEGYDLNIGDGYVIGEADKEGINEFLKVAHGVDFTPAQVKAAIKFSLDQQSQEVEARREADVEARIRTTNELKQEFGDSYKMNMNLVSGFVNTVPSGVKDLFMGGRLADGTPIFSNTDMIRWFSTLALESNPMPTLTGGGQNPSQAIEGEIAGLRRMMGDNNSEYWKGPNAEKNQARYRELVEAEQRIKNKA